MGRSVDKATARCGLQAQCGQTHGTHTGLNVTILFRQYVTTGVCWKMCFTQNKTEKISIMDLTREWNTQVVCFQAHILVHFQSFFMVSVYATNATERPMLIDFLWSKDVDSP